MAEFLRYSVAYSKKPSATLAEELEHVQNYLGIERERAAIVLQRTGNTSSASIPLAFVDAIE